jgi:O-succinylbenzoate synthase
MVIPNKKKALSNIKSFQVELNTSMKSEMKREGVLIQGDFGWAEFAPFEYHSMEHSARWLQAALEMAWTELPKSKVDSVAVNAISPSSDPVNGLKVLEETGCKILKVKLGQANIEKEIYDLHQISRTSKVKFRIDFNASLDIKKTLDYAKELKEIDVEYFEQPCESIIELKELRKQIDIPLAIDENLRLASDATDKNLIKQISEACDFIVVKPIPVGGITRFVQIAEEVLGLNKSLIVSSSMDTSIGIYLTTLAQSLINDRSTNAAGAGTGSLLKTDVVSQTLKAHDGYVLVQRMNLDESKLVPSTNEKELNLKLNEAFDYGHDLGWF